MGMKIVTVVGARPQFVKASVLSRQFKQQPGAEEILVHTGQHYDPSMSDLFFDELDIPKPHYNLEVGSGNHGYQTGEMLKKIEEVLLKEKPQYLLVYGDTNSTIAGALAAAKLHIPVVHIEAGLRSFNRQMPEEINRVLTDHCSDMLFAPTETAVNNLRTEGVSDDKIFLCGDVMYDAALYFAKKAASQANILDRLKLEPQKFALSTCHRAENTNDPERLTAVLGALAAYSEEVPVVLPLHPRVQNIVKGQDQYKKYLDKITVIEPVGYLDMIMLEKNAQTIITDSGGVQKEAFFFKVPCITLRDETEWTELVDLGWNSLASPALGADQLVNHIKEHANREGQQGEPYGQGQAGEFIFSRLMSEQA